MAGSVLNVRDVKNESAIAAASKHQELCGRNLLASVRLSIQKFIVLDYKRFPLRTFDLRGLEIDKVDKLYSVISIWRDCQPMEYKHKLVVNSAHRCTASWLLQRLKLDPSVIVHVVQLDCIGYLVLADRNLASCGDDVLISDKANRSVKPSSFHRAQLLRIEVFI